MKAGYITIVLLGIASNSLYFINQTALLFIIITIMFMLFRHWKPAFLYMFCAFPALFFKGFEIITAFDRNMVVSILKLRFAYDYVPYTDIYDVSRYFYSVDRLFYIVIYAFAAAAVIMMFAPEKKEYTDSYVLCFRYSYRTYVSGEYGRRIIYTNNLCVYSYGVIFSAKRIFAYGREELQKN